MTTITNNENEHPFQRYIVKRAKGIEASKGVHKPHCRLQNIFLSNLTWCMMPSHQHSLCTLNKILKVKSSQNSFIQEIHVHIKIHRKDWSPVGLIDPFSLVNSARYITTSLLTSKQNKVTNVLVLGCISKICAINGYLDIALCLKLRQLIWIYDTDTTWGNSTVQSHYKSF